MRLRKAADAFLQSAEPSDISATSNDRSIDLLIAFFKDECELDEITPSALRDFLARYYIEQASAKASEIPAPNEMLRSVKKFFSWASVHSASKFADERMKVIAELENSLPRTLEIFITLSSHLAGRGGAFAFPEYLTSFEEGGRSEYDIDSGGDAGAREGYFRVARIEGTKIEAEELITEDRVWPVLFPAEAVRLLEPGHIINLEIILVSDGWHITSCGFAYPPGTEILEG